MVNSAQTLTLYVDGACRGNPGIGGWGVLIIDEQGLETELYGGEPDTTNNRMELMAAIQGVTQTPAQHALVIYTDSSYVQKGMTEWIKGWKAKNWKNVKNPDLWQTLDQAAQGRQIEWKWIKGHAGHEGNERADRLANLGADGVSSNSLSSDTANSDTANLDTPNQDTAKKKAETLTTAQEIPPMSKSNDDWLLNDPFGLDDDAESDTTETQLLEDESIEDEPLEAESVEDQSIQSHTVASDSTASVEATSTETAISDPLLAKVKPSIAAQIKITPAKQHMNGPRQLILDTETTGFYYQDSDRIIEVGAIEMVNRRLTGSSIHIYINPQKAVGESENIHGLSDEFLSDKPLFGEIASVLFEYLKGAEIIAHNATFDMNFLNAEFERTGLGKLSTVCSVTDTLLIAKRKHPGQKNSLDALVRRYEIPARDRTFHGALLDAEILADVYLAMTGGQVSLDIDQTDQSSANAQAKSLTSSQNIDVPIILPQIHELDAHQAWLQKYNEKNENPCLFSQADKS